MYNLNTSLTLEYLYNNKNIIAPVCIDIHRNVESKAGYN